MSTDVQDLEQQKALNHVRLTAAQIPAPPVERLIAAVRARGARLMQSDGPTLHLLPLGFWLVSAGVMPV